MQKRPIRPAHLAAAIALGLICPALVATPAFAETAYEEPAAVQELTPTEELVTAPESAPLVTEDVSLTEPTEAPAPDPVSVAPEQITVEEVVAPEADVAGDVAPPAGDPAVPISVYAPASPSAAAPTTNLNLGVNPDFDYSYRDSILNGYIAGFVPDVSDFAATHETEFAKQGAYNFWAANHTVGYLLLGGSHFIPWYPEGYQMNALPELPGEYCASTSDPLVDWATTNQGMRGRLDTMHSPPFGIVTDAQAKSVVVTDFTSSACAAEWFGSSYQVSISGREKPYLSFSNGQLSFDADKYRADFPDDNLPNPSIMVLRSDNVMFQVFVNYNGKAPVVVVEKPVGFPYWVSALEGEPVTVSRTDILRGASWASGDVNTLGVTVTELPAGATLNSDGGFTYTPTVLGAMTFPYLLVDPISGVTSEPLTGTMWVNEAPVTIPTPEDPEPVIPDPEPTPELVVPVLLPEVPAVATAQPVAQQLAHTGSDSAPSLFAGLLLLLAGIGAVIVGRRKRASQSK
jgi:LPXTG-motif cell wall-anchored protein